MQDVVKIPLYEPLVCFLDFFSAFFSFMVLAGFFFPSFLVSMFLLMMSASVVTVLPCLGVPAQGVSGWTQFILLSVRLQAGLTASTSQVVDEGIELHREEALLTKICWLGF
jgi:hypothetical protein